MKPSISNELKPVHLYLLALPLMLVTNLVDIVNLGGWDISIYFIHFLYGYFFLTKSSFKAVVQRMLPVNMIVAVASTIIFVYGFMMDLPVAGGGLNFLFASVKALNSWCWLLVIFSLADRKLSHSNKWLKYGNQASMPFYVLHPARHCHIRISYHRLQLVYTSKTYHSDDDRVYDHHDHLSFHNLKNFLYRDTIW